MLSTIDITEKLKQRNEFLKKISNGEKVVCPKCQKGIMKHRGNYYYYCDSKECNLKISIDRSRD